MRMNYKRLALSALLGAIIGMGTYYFTGSYWLTLLAAFIVGLLI